MPTIIFKEKKHHVSTEQFKEIKEMSTPQFEPRRELEFEKVAVYVGNRLIGHVALKILEEILFRKKIVLSA